MYSKFWVFLCVCIVVMSIGVLPFPKTLIPILEVSYRCIFAVSGICDIADFASNHRLFFKKIESKIKEIVEQHKFHK